MALKPREALVETESCAPGDAGAPGVGTAPPVRALASGDVVAGRYHVLRFIANGAMGEVYAVEDLALRERVALKLIRPELASQPRALERFTRELLLARRVTHPGVCRVFDLGRHVGPGPDGVEREVTFLTMELLEGQTLREHLARHGRLAPGEVLEVARQLAAALDAAHAAQVIHRDLKTGNIMLVPAAGPRGGTRVVVTDFGLARGEPREGDQALSREGAFLGSPGYMSPEQVACRPVTPATDVYSFGVVLFELVTGRLPFLADAPLAAAIKRLSEPPPEPCGLVPALAPVWDQVLLRCLALAPEKRFATASEAVAALEYGEALSREAEAAAREPPSPAPPQGQLLRVVLLCAAVVVALGTAVLWRPGSKAGEPAPVPEAAEGPARTARRSVAVLAPRNLSSRPDAAWLSTALAEMLSAELAGGSVRVLSGESVARMVSELGLPEGESFAADTLRRIRAHSGADLVLTGGYLLLAQEDGAALRLDLRLQDAEGGETVAHVTEAGPEKDLLALMSRVGGALRARLGLAPLTTEQLLGVRSTLPASPGTARLYAEGLAALRGWSPAIAVERFQRVVELEPGFAPAHSALASAFKQLFQDGSAREAARRAYELSGGLPREERLLLEARHHAANASWGPAIEAYRTLWEFFPDNLEYGIELASAQVSAGQHREALATLDALRRLPPPLGEDARIDYVAALAKLDSADYVAACQHTSQAVARARRAGQSLMVARALTWEAFALRNLGEPSQAAERVVEAERLFHAAGDRGGVAWAQLLRAIVLTDRVRLREAEAVYADALRSAAEFRGTSLEAEVLVNAGWLRCHVGQQQGALDFTSRARALFQQLGLQHDAVSATIQLGMVLRRRGELNEAQALLEEGAEASRASLQNDYQEAWARYELGHLLLDRGWPRLAREPLERALALRKGRGLEAFVAESELALARLALAEGRSEEALTWVESARAVYAAQRTADKEGLARAMEVRVLLARDDTAGAREAMAQARALAGGSENVFIAAEVALTAARLAARAGSPDERREATRDMEALARQSSAGGMPGVALEARLAALELKRAEGAPLREEARALESEALERGYLDLSMRAGRMARD